MLNCPKKSVTGGCAAFGHSCYGGHGKRSQGIDLIPPGSEMSDIDLNRRTLGDQDAILPEQFSRVHDVLQKPDREVETLLQRLVSIRIVCTNAYLCTSDLC